MSGLRRIVGFAVLCAGLLAALSPAHAVLPDEMLAEPGLEARARALSAGLRCLICQNQSIDDSEAPLARDLRLLVRERLTAGDSDAEVEAFVVARYGEFVLLRPPFEWSTLLLWLTPAALLLVAAGVVARSASSMRARGGRGQGRGSALTPEEEEKLSKLLAGKDGSKSMD
jgi:cytochrome c-type biogenesis protein CcmH